MNWKSALLPILALCGVALVLVNTRWGAYLSDDTYYYIYPAQDLLAGKGFNPSYIFGPMFPLVLAGVGLTGVNILAAVRWLNAILFGVNIFLVGSITRRLNVSIGFSLLAAGLVLLSDVVAEAHGWAMSEALGFTFILLSLAFCLDFLASQRRRDWWLAVIAAGLAVLTRYASIPLIGAIALVLLIFPVGKRFIYRLKDAALFGAISLAPVALYWVRNQIIIYYGFRTLDFSRQVFNTGLGYSNVGWHNSETVAYIKAHPEMTTMVSTGEMGIYFWTQRMPKTLADFSDPQALKDYLCQTKAPLFIMNQMPTEIYGLEHDAVVKDLAWLRISTKGRCLNALLINLITKGNKGNIWSQNLRNSKRA